MGRPRGGRAGSFLSGVGDGSHCRLAPPCQGRITWGPGMVSMRVTWGPGMVGMGITQGPGMVGMRFAWGPGMVSMRATWGPGLVGSIKVWQPSAALETTDDSRLPIIDWRRPWFIENDASLLPPSDPSSKPAPRILLTCTYVMHVCM